MQIVTLERRLRDLERTTHKKNFLCLHEVETAPPTGIGATYVKTHEYTPYRVFVAPLRLYGHIRVLRASAVVRSSVVDGTAVDMGLAIYKYNPSPYEYSDPIKASEPYTLTRVAILGTTTHFSPETLTAERFNADLTKEVVLDPRKSNYFVAYNTSEYGEWFCPGWGAGEKARRKGRQTGHVGESAIDFPRELTVNADVAPVPWIALRSSLGVRLYGDVAQYG